MDASDRRTGRAAGDCRLGRRQRLVRTEDIQSVFRSGRRRAGRLMVLWYRPGSEETPRLAVAAAKRTFRRSVDRARAKRLMREAFRLNRDRLAERLDVVLVARWAILDAGRAGVEDELLRLAGQLGIAKGRATGR